MTLMNMGKSKLVILIGLASVLIISFNLVLAAPLTGTVASPSNNQAGKGAQYLIKFTTATTGTVAKVQVTFPAGFNLAQLSSPAIAQMSNSSGILPISNYTLAVSGQTATWTINQPQVITSGTTITLFAAKAINTVTTGPATVSIETLDGSNNPIDGPTTASLSIAPVLFIDNSGNVGIGTNTPQAKLDVAGNIRLSGNITSPNDICIGSC